MSKSMFDTKKGTCFICGCHGYTEKHHIFGGVANRRLSEADGLWVYLCLDHHNRPPEGVHFNAERMKMLRQIGQIAYENKLIKEGVDPDEAHWLFIQRYGKNYL